MSKTKEGREGKRKEPLALARTARPKQMLLLPNKPPTLNPESSGPVPGSIGENRNFYYNEGNDPQIGTMLLFISVFWSSATLVVLREQML